MTFGKRWKRFIDKAIYPVGLAGPLVTYVQAAKIYIEKDASGVSALAWTGYVIISFFWINYGSLNKVWPVLLVEGLAFLGYVLVVVGTFIY